MSLVRWSAGCGRDAEGRREPKLPAPDAFDGTELLRADTNASLRWRVGSNEVVFVLRAHDDAALVDGKVRGRRPGVAPNVRSDVAVDHLRLSLLAVARIVRIARVRVNEPELLVGDVLAVSYSPLDVDRLADRECGVCARSGGA